MSQKGRLPRRDFILLPAICIATLLLLVGIPELIAAHMFYQHKVDACLRPDPVLGDRALPNCQSRYKPGEGPWTENHYNECGYRSSESCLTKPADTFRVALIGSSTATGYLVPYDQTFAVRSETILSNTCGHPVEFQSLGGLGYQWRRLEARMDEALKLKPDLVVAAITPFDVRQPLNPPPLTGPQPHGVIASIVGGLRSIVQGSSLWMAVLHYRADLPVTYLRFFLRDAERSDFLRQPLSAFWQQQLGYTGTLIQDLATKARAGNVPLLVMFVPQRAQAVLMKYHADFPDMAPLTLDHAIAKMVQNNGGTFLDMTPTFAAADNLNPLFYAVDDHITGAGSAMVADRLSQTIMAARYPGLQSCAPLKAASAGDRPSGSYPRGE